MPLGLSSQFLGFVTPLLTPSMAFWPSQRSVLLALSLVRPRVVRLSLQAAGEEDVFGGEGVVAVDEPAPVFEAGAGMGSAAGLEGDEFEGDEVGVGGEQLPVDFDFHVVELVFGQWAVGLAALELFGGGGFQGFDLAGCGVVPGLLSRRGGGDDGDAFAGAADDDEPVAVFERTLLGELIEAGVVGGCQTGHERGSRAGGGEAGRAAGLEPFALSSEDSGGEFRRDAVVNALELGGHAVVELLELG
jgi:hypothetical protein